MKESKRVISLRVIEPSEIPRAQILECNRVEPSNIFIVDAEPYWENIEFCRPDIKGANQYLTSCGWSSGMQETLIKSLNKIPIRFWVIDDSGSMLMNDGKRRVGNGNTFKIISCSRWSELITALKFHVGLISAANAQSEFRFINERKPVIIGGAHETDYRDKVCKRIF